MVGDTNELLDARYSEELLTLGFLSVNGLKRALNESAKTIACKPCSSSSFSTLEFGGIFYFFDRI